ncbi:MAG: hypothetical protein JWQ93_1216 [Marmoricola sp.]|jgi:hypothetical protein|nr:hypothetical protein [Marmoricola sp.]
MLAPRSMAVRSTAVLAAVLTAVLTAVLALVGAPAMPFAVAQAATQAATQAAPRPAAPRVMEPPWCAAGDLHVSYHATGAATSHRFGRIVLTNVSDHRCRTGGYGGLSYVGRHGHQVGAAADRDPGTVRIVVLRPGQRVHSEVSETVAGVFPRATCRPAPVRGFRVFAPDSTTSQIVEHHTTGCRNASVHLISHRPYVRP